MKNHNMWFILLLLSLVFIGSFGAINPGVALIAVIIAGIFFAIWYFKEMDEQEKENNKVMSLAYKKDTYSYNGEYEMSSVNKFAQAERRLAAKKQALDDMKNEYSLIEQQAFHTYKENIQYMLLDQPSTIKTCNQWLNMLSKNQDTDGNKLDKRKKYKEKEIYDWYIDYIRKLLDIEYMNDVKFIDCNFGQATNIQFEYKEHNWYLEIPHIKAVKLDEYRNYGSNAFKLRLVHNDTEYSSSWSQFGSTYEEDDLKNIMAQGIEKYCKRIDLEE